MKLTTDEHRALAFIAALLFLSAAVRVIGLPEPVAVPEGMDLAGHIEAVEAAVSERAAAERPLAPGETVDPNTATAAELTRLPRVGSALAERIVADRAANGRYRSLADLGRVTGVGDRMLELFAPHIALPAEGAAAGSLSRPRPVGGVGSARVGGPGGVDGTGGVGAPGVIDLNRATAAELTSLTGIGPVLAGRIVAYRDSVGGFSAVDDIAGVKGIGPATLARIRGQVVVRQP